MNYTPPKYPSAIPTITDLPDREDFKDWLVAARYNELKKELRAALIELGVLPKGSSASVVERIKGIRSLADAVADVIIVKLGKVGIGTSEPGRPLEIYDTSAILRMRSSQVSANVAQAFIEFGGTDEGVWHRTGYIGDVGILGADITLRAEEGALRFGDSSGGNIVVIIGGKVGIGTATPGEKLRINGDLGIENGLMRMKKVYDAGVGTFTPSGRSGILIVNGIRWDWPIGHSASRMYFYFTREHGVDAGADDIGNYLVELGHGKHNWDANPAPTVTLTATGDSNLITVANPGGNMNNFKVYEMATN